MVWQNVSSIRIVMWRLSTNWDGRWRPKYKTEVTLKGMQLFLMGGIDLTDVLLEIYRINQRSKNRHFNIFFWCLRTSVTNAWQLYSKHIEKIIPHLQRITLLKFKMEIAHDLLQCTSLLSKKSIIRRAVVFLSIKLLQVSAESTSLIALRQTRQVFVEKGRFVKHEHVEMH